MGNYMLKFKEYSTELDALLDQVQLTPEEMTQIDEVLDTHQRFKKRQAFIRRSARLALARKIQSKRLATTERLKGRAKNRAKSILIKRLYQGRSRSEIPLSQRKQVDQKLERMKGSIKRIAGKLLRRVKQDDVARKSGTYKKSKTSSNGAF